MSGWLTPKLECNKKLQAIPPPREPEGGREGGREGRETDSERGRVRGLDSSHTVMAEVTCSPTRHWKCP